MKKVILLASALLSLVGVAALGQTGNVGIGTSAPGSKLSVKGNAIIGDAYSDLVGPANGLAVEGRLGVGTSIPRGIVEVIADNVGAAAGNDFYFRAYGNSINPGLYLMSARGTHAAPVALQTNDLIGGVYFGSYSTAYNLYDTGILGIYRGDGTNNKSAMSLRTSGLDRMRVNEDGDVMVDLTAPLGSTDIPRLSVNTASPVGSYIRSTNSELNGLLILEKEGVSTSNDEFVYFRENGADIGSISANAASGVLFNVTSDMRLKENIRETAYGIKDVMKIHVRDYNYKTNKNIPQTGFIAQQLYTVFPNAVSRGGADISKPWMVDYSKLTPLLAKAIQDQQAEIEALKKENATFRTNLAQVVQLTDELNQLKVRLDKLSGNDAVGKSLAK